MSHGAHGRLPPQMPPHCGHAASLLGQAATDNLGHQPRSLLACEGQVETNLRKQGRDDRDKQTTLHNCSDRNSPLNATQFFPVQSRQVGKGQKLLQLRCQISLASHHGSLDPPGKGYELRARYVSLVLEDTLWPFCASLPFLYLGPRETTKCASHSTYLEQSGDIFGCGCPLPCRACDPLACAQHSLFLVGIFSNIPSVNTLLNTV